MNQQKHDNPESMEETKPETENPKSDKGHPPMKGTDTPAHTALEYADREKGKRTTM